MGRGHAFCHTGHGVVDKPNKHLAMGCLMGMGIMGMGNSKAR